MVTVIYADLLFLVNLAADYIILFLTRRFSGAKTGLARLMLSSLIGAISGTAIHCAGLHRAWQLAGLAAVSVIMCVTAFGKKKHPAFRRILFFFYFSSFLLYGGASAMYHVFSMNTGSVFTEPGFIAALIFIGAAAFIYTLSSSLCTRAAKSSDNKVKVELCDGCKTYELQLYCDSGNFAKDPFSGRPVTVISQSVLDPELYSALSGTVAGGTASERYRHIKPRVIPIKTVSGTTLLYAFIPESMYICDSSGRHPVDSIIAIDTHDNVFYGKDGIIPGILLETI